MRFFEPGPDRAALRFLESAEREFSFLLERGCTILDRQTTRLRYECPTTLVTVFHARGGYNLGVEIGLRSDLEVDADLAEIMALTGAGPMASTTAETAEAVARVLPDLARLVRAHAEPALAGERWIFDAVHDHRREMTLKFTRAVPP